MAKTRAPWRNPDALEQLFDRHAPSLFRLGVHLLGDATQAEDLVQETFLAVLKSEGNYDASRPIEPWLRGILVNHAKRYRRAAARTVDVRAIVERGASSPLQSALGDEEAGGVAEAIDRLEEPYRQVLLLRLRHGMSAPDIAHVLGRTPATVRVQLHRGITILRQVLPGAVVLLGLLPGTAAQGLAAVRDSVLAQARAEATTALGGSIVGGTLMGKTILTACGAVLALLLAVLVWQPREMDPENGPPPTRGADRVLKESASEVIAPSLIARTEAPPHVSPVPRPQAFQGIVINAKSQDPLSDCAVAFFAVGQSTVANLKREAGAQMEQQPDGKVRSLTSTPAVLRALTAGELLGDLFVPVFDEPGEDAEALASAATGPDGRFALATPLVHGVLRVSKKGFGTRIIPAQGGATSIQIRLSPMRIISGRVLDPAGDPLTGVLEILLSGGETNSVVAPADKTRANVPGAGVLVQTDAQGRFEARVASQWLSERCRTPGYRLERRDAEDWRKPTRSALQTWAPGEAPRPVTLVAFPDAALVVRDATTKQPIEDFFLHARDRSMGLLSWSGRFYAPGGRLGLLQSDIQRTRAKGNAITLHVWAEGYRPEAIRVEDLNNVQWIEVDLHPGEAPSLRGTVVRRSEVAAGAQASLMTFRPIAWSEHDDDFVSWARSDEAGRFSLQAPQGRYVLRIEDGGSLYQRVVHVGEDDDLTIDLEETTGIEVHVHDSGGKLRADHAVGINGDDGRSTRAYTDAEGTAWLPLPAGRYKIFVPQVSTKGSFVADELRSIVLASGERKTITFTVPDPTIDVFVQLTCDTDVDFTTWRARQIDRLGGDQVPVRADGTVPIAVQAGVRQIEVELPGGQRIDLSIPKSPTDAVKYHIRLLGPRYEGVLRSESGSPRAGIRIIATPLQGQGESRPSVSCVTDAEGRFVLACNAAVPHAFGFNKDPARVSWNHLAGGLDGLWYTPTDLPSDDPVSLDVRLRSNQSPPGQAAVRVHGIVRCEDPSQKPASLRMSIVLLYLDPQGQMQVSTKQSFVSPDEQGRYEARLPRAPRYRAHVYDRGTGKPVAQATWAYDGEGRPSEHDFVVPRGP